jgi:hypothetical protein
MTGLDPGVHPSFARSFPEKMDCRVKPGNDELKNGEVMRR